MVHQADNVSFQLGALVAVGDLFESGLLGERGEAAVELCDLMSGFGIADAEDAEKAGLRGEALRSVQDIFATCQAQLKKQAALCTA